MFVPTQLLHNWYKQRPSSQGDLVSSIMGECITRGWTCFDFTFVPQDVIVAGLRFVLEITNPFKCQINLASGHNYYTRNSDISICVKFPDLKSKTGTHVLAVSHGQQVYLPGIREQVLQSESLFFKCLKLLYVSEGGGRSWVESKTSPFRNKNTEPWATQSCSTPSSPNTAYATLHTCSFSWYK
jgi:hypothetical protein